MGLADLAKDKCEHGMKNITISWPRCESLAPKFPRTEILVHKGIDWLLIADGCRAASKSTSADDVDVALAMRRLMTWRVIAAEDSSADVPQRMTQKMVMRLYVDGPFHPPITASP